MQTRVFEASAAGNLRWPDGSALCALGRSGVIDAAHKQEGDGATPLGSWDMRQVFFRPDRLAPPETSLPAIPLTPRMGWCDDPASPDYNTLVALPFAARHELLWREDGLYDLVVVLGYNDAPPVAGRGSAIFMHVAQPDLSPTEGCIATGLASLLSLVGAAAPGDRLTISR
ncbi:MAG: L,D-transpeptidase family protein [Alphaproteobacteria bacterium]|nr:L,D-transpeptidase family protein [Alphaproteobacteria bacterium]